MMKFAVMGVSALALAGVAAPALAQKSKDTVRIGLGAPIRTMSYYLDPKPETVFESEAIFDNLIIYDEDNHKFEPLLAKSWKQVDDTTLEYQLRDDVKWHDGEKFTADDVVYTLNWLIDPKVQLRFKGNWSFIAKVEKTGPYTVRVHTKEPTPYALTRLAYLTSIEAKHAHGKAEDKTVYGATHPVGTGMYKVVDIDRNKHVLLERNKDYKHGGTAKRASNVGKLELLPIPDAGTQVAQFLAGGLDVVRDPGLDTAEDMAKSSKAVITMGEGTSYLYMAIDAKGRSGVKALTDVRVRRALMMAVNRKDIMQFVTHGRDLPQPQNMCWKFQAGCDYTLKPYGYDPAGAKKLLAQAGYGDGFDLEITTFTAETIKGTAQIVANQFNQIGIKASVTPYELGAYRKKQGDGKIQVIVAGWPGGGNPDTQGTLDFIYNVPPSRDYTGDKEMQDLARQSLEIMDPQKRLAVGRKVFDMSTERAYFMALAPSPGLFVHTPDITLHAGAYSAYSLNPQGIRWK